MLKSKKTQIPMVLTIVILLTVTIILITTMLILFNMKSVSIDDKKLNTQIAIKKVLNSNCFSDEYGVIELDKYTENNLKKCFKGNKNIYMVLGLENKNRLFLKDEEKTKEKIKLCSTKSSLFCSELKYPILLKTQNSYTSTTLRLIIISN